MEEGDNEKESLRDISQQWNLDIYNNLKQLEKYEQIITLGSKDLYEFIFNLKFPKPELIFIEAKIKTIEFFLIEFQRILETIKRIISEEKYKSLKEKCLKVLIIYKGSEGNLSKDCFDNRSSHSVLKNILLLNPFYKCVEEIKMLRSDLINCEGISKLLFKIPTKNKQQQV